MVPSQRRFTWKEMRTYWQLHSSHWAGIDYQRDPDGLTNVCFPGAPLWLNHYYARFQKKVYRTLFMRIPPPVAGARALDIGCGAGRWCRFLNERGYETTGIDLQPELIEINRDRYPDMDFICMSIQDYVADEPFDVVSAVTVVQHIPFDEQDIVFRKLRELVGVNGYAILLEGIHYQRPNAFSNTVEDWQARVERVGFRCLAIRRYDYSPLQRFNAWRIRGAGRILWGKRSQDIPRSPEALASFSFAGVPGFSDWLSLNLDAMVEPILVRLNLPLAARHCGFLFKAI